MQTRLNRLSLALALLSVSVLSAQNKLPSAPPLPVPAYPAPLAQPLALPPATQPNASAPQLNAILVEAQATPGPRVLRVEARVENQPTWLAKIPYIGRLFKNKAIGVQEYPLDVDFDVAELIPGNLPATANVVVGFNAPNKSNSKKNKVQSCPSGNCQTTASQPRLQIQQQWQPARVPPTTFFAPPVSALEPPACSSCPLPTSAPPKHPHGMVFTMAPHQNGHLSPLVKELLEEKIKNARLEVALEAQQQISQMKEQMFGALAERMSENAHLKAKAEFAEQIVELVGEVAEEKVEMMGEVAGTMVEAARATAIVEAVAPLHEMAQRLAVHNLEKSADTNAHTNAPHHDVHRLHGENAQLRKKIAELENAIQQIRAASIPRTIGR